MLELDATNVVDYLRERGLIASDRIASARALGWGVSNVVLRVDTPAVSMVVKQSRQQLRTREPWFSRLDRSYREADALRVIGTMLPPGTVPNLLFEDRPNYAFGMSAIAADHTVWKQELLAGAADAGIARRAGALLGQLHADSAGRSEFAAPFTNREVFVELRLEPFYWRLKSRYPDHAVDIDRIVAEMFDTAVCLTHADFSPKNLLIDRGELVLVDYETVHWGDPAFDIGFFLSHLFLKALYHAPRHARYFDLIRAFWDRYTAGVRGIGTRLPALGLGELTRRAVGHFALCVLARIDGTSPVDYLTNDAKRCRARSVARRAITEGTACWETILSISEADTL